MSELGSYYSLLPLLQQTGLCIHRLLYLAYKSQCPPYQSSDAVIRAACRFYPVNFRSLFWKHYVVKYLCMSV